MSTRKGRLVAVDGVNGAAVMKAATAEVAAVARRRRGGISEWDASGVFGDLIVADPAAGRASARTLMLLYAADLAFRLRWEIRPALASGKVVVAAPYVETAVAFGRAAGLPAAWLKDLLAFAPNADASRIVGVAPSRTRRTGFVEFGCTQANGRHGLTPAHLTTRAGQYLRRAAQRGRRAR